MFFLIYLGIFFIWFIGFNYYFYLLTGHPDFIIFTEKTILLDKENFINLIRLSVDIPSIFRPMFADTLVLLYGFALLLHIDISIYKI